jgi:hypothetical protein
MKVMASRQYYQAMLTSFELKKYTDALDISLKAEAVCSDTPLSYSEVNVTNGRGPNSIMVAESFVYENAYRSTTCNIYLMSGIVRNTINSLLEQQKQQLTSNKKDKQNIPNIKLNKKQKYELSRSQELLLRVIDPYCVYALQNTNVNTGTASLSEHATMAIGMLTNMYSQSDKLNDAIKDSSKSKDVQVIKKKMDLAMMTFKATHVYFRMLFIEYENKLKAIQSKLSEGQNLNDKKYLQLVDGSPYADIRKHLLDSHSTSIKLFDEAGQVCTTTPLLPHNTSQPILYLYQYYYYNTTISNFYSIIIVTISLIPLQAYFEMENYEISKFCFEKILQQFNFSKLLYTASAQNEISKPQYNSLLFNISDTTLSKLFPTYDSYCSVKYWYAQIDIKCITTLYNFICNVGMHMRLQLQKGFLVLFRMLVMF